MLNNLTAFFQRITLTVKMLPQLGRNLIHHSNGYNFITAHLVTYHQSPGYKSQKESTEELHAGDANRHNTPQRAGKAAAVSCDPALLAALLYRETDTGDHPV